MTMAATTDARQWRQAALITFGAAALYVTMRALPTGTNLHSGDFRVAGAGALELCDPANPQFVPVVAARSPVTMTVTPAPDGGNNFLLRLATSTGKPLGPSELLEVHTKKLHLLIVDPTLGDYQHVHPEPTANLGEWSFAFAPRFAETYRVFADFTPVVTGRSLYASADIAAAATPKTESDSPARSSADRSAGANAPHPAWENERDGFRFTLAPSAQPVRAGQAVDLTFTATRTDGGAAALEPVMGALAHLVAFDAERSGFAHLHPVAADPPDAARPALAFKLTIPCGGRYVIWAQVKLAGREVFVPFWFEVAP
jgi:hypothetical protein